MVTPDPDDRYYRRLARAVLPLLGAISRRDHGPAASLPATGGVIVCPNHISNADPLFVARYLVLAGRWPRFLAKSGLWDAPVIGRLVRGTGQIPVQRRSATAGSSLDAAAAALERGECVVVYPEGTVTHDPGAWPMTGYPGAARLARRTGVPVLPLAQWGAHEIFDRWHVGVPRLWRRPRIVMRLGEPVDVASAPDDRVATERIMAALVSGLEEIRGERAPERRFDMRRDWAAGFRADGRPNEG